MESLCSFFYNNNKVAALVLCTLVHALCLTKASYDGSPHSNDDASSAVLISLHGKKCTSVHHRIGKRFHQQHASDKAQSYLAILILDPIHNAMLTVKKYKQILVLSESLEIALVQSFFTYVKPHFIQHQRCCSKQQSVPSKHLISP